MQLTVKQLHITTSYSGVGSAEWVVKFIHRAFKGRGFDVGMQMYSACDNDDHCSEVLSSHKEPPLHCFDNLLDRIPAHALAKLRDLQNKYLAKLPTTAKEAAKGNKTVSARAAKELGQKFFDVACNYLDTVELDGDAKAWCRTCESNCPLCPGKEGGVVWVGNRRGYMRPLVGRRCLVWLARPSIISFSGMGLLVTGRAAAPHH